MTDVTGAPITTTLHAAGIAIGLIHHWKSGRRVLQGAGALVMAGGLYFLWKIVA